MPRVEPRETAAEYLGRVRWRDRDPWLQRHADAAVERISRYGQSTAPGQRKTTTALAVPEAQP